MQGFTPWGTSIWKVVWLVNKVDKFSAITNYLEIKTIFKTIIFSSLESDWKIYLTCISRKSHRVVDDFQVCICSCSRHGLKTHTVDLSFENYEIEKHKTTLSMYSLSQPPSPSYLQAASWTRLLLSKILFRSCHKILHTLSYSTSFDSIL